MWDGLIPSHIFSIIMNILIVILSILITCGIMCLIFIPKVKHTIARNNIIEAENSVLQERNDALKIQSQNLKAKTEELRQQTLNIKWEYNTLQARRDEVKNSLDDLEEQSNQAVQKIYNSALEIAQNSFDKQIEKMSKELDEERTQAQKIYIDTLKDCVDDFLQEFNQKEQQLLVLNNLLAKEQKNVDIAVEAAKRRQEMEDKQDFYRLVLSNDDVKEIKKLREVLPYLRDKTPLNKVIYKVYYEKPLTDMIGRVVGTGVHTGIYKITHISSEKCYIGQAANIADRWKQHCKRGVGAEDWTQNKLYPAMYSLGVENFTFEVVEECERSKLNEKEKYWTEFFHAQDFGYSIRSG